MSELAPVYALRVRGEARAAYSLGESGISAWAPTYMKLREGFRGRAHLVETPLIAGYVFARLRPEDFAAAMSTERVFGVVTGASGAPAAVPEGEWVKVLLMAMSGKFDDREPATKARPRGHRRRGLLGLQAWFDAVKSSQLKMQPNHGSVTIGGEPVSEGMASSRRSTRPSRMSAWAKVRSVA